MSKDVLRGNFETRKQGRHRGKKTETLEDRFEMEARSASGGSIAYVSKKEGHVGF